MNFLCCIFSVNIHHPQKHRKRRRRTHAPSTLHIDYTPSPGPPTTFTNYNPSLYPPNMLPTPLNSSYDRSQWHAATQAARSNEPSFTPGSSSSISGSTLVPITHLLIPFMELIETLKVADRVRGPYTSHKSGWRRPIKSSRSNNFVFLIVLLSKFHR